MSKHILSVLIGIIFTCQLHAQKEYKVKISTELGDIVVKLYNDTPIHRDNFIKNVKNGWYDNTLFHRVMPFFMAQGGDPNSIDAPETQSLGSDRCETLPAEIRRHHFHKKGALAAARIPDGANPDRRSSGCQFFLVQGYKYTDAQLDAMENENYKFPDFNRAHYKVKGGAPHLDMQYTIFGEVIEGIEVIDLICAMPTGEHVVNRPNTDVKMTCTMVE